jgi:hypothetical protein
LAVDALPAVRRVVTANDIDGQSFLLTDGPSPDQRTVPERPGYRISNLWRTVGAPAPVDADDSVLEHQGVMPPPHGTVLRVIDFPPRPLDPHERRRQAAASFRNLFPDALHATDHRQAGMHTTLSIDYAIVLWGVITAIMDRGETDLAAGDILIQRATNHAWENRGDKIARVCFILVDGKV